MQYAYFYNFAKDRDGRDVIVPAEDAAYSEAVLIPTKGYHGLLKALDIVRDRACQQIDKSRADEHGYTLLRAERRQYGRSEYRPWMVTKRTPYGVRTPYEDVSAIIGRDLNEFYGLECVRSLSNIDLIDGEKGRKAEIARILYDFARGCFEITYWAPRIV